MPSRQILFWAFAFLLAAVPLVPFRYLVLPGLVPGFLVLAVQYAPVGVSLLAGALWYWRRRGGLAETLGRLPLGWPVAALLLTGLISSVGAEQPLVSTAKSLYYFATGGLLFLVLVDQVRDAARARVLLYVFLGAGYAVALYGILEFAAGVSPLYGAFFSPENEAYRRLIPDPWFGRRIVSTIGHPVALGAYLVLILPISLGAALSAPRRRVQVILLAGTGCVLLALVLTGSRGAWLAAVAALAAYLYLRGARYLLLLPVVLAVVVGAVLSFSAVSDAVTPRAREVYKKFVVNFDKTQRGAAWGYVAVMASRHPLLGLGTGMYRFEAYSLRAELDFKKTDPPGVLDTPDNMYLMWLAESGGMGLVVALYVVSALLARLWRAGRGLGAGGGAGGDGGSGWQDGPGSAPSDHPVGPAPERPATAVPAYQQNLAWGFVAALVGLCVDMLTVDALYFPVTRTCFWIVAGLGVVLLQDTEVQCPTE